MHPEVSNRSCMYTIPALTHARAVATIRNANRRQVFTRAAEGPSLDFRCVDQL